MCYNDCKYFHFNPMTGYDKCKLPKDEICPENEDFEAELLEGNLDYPSEPKYDQEDR